MTIATPHGEFAERDVPLAVDLDGTLIAGDSLAESALLLIKEQPWCLLLIPFWLLQGRAKLKSEVAQRVRLAGEMLPYRPEIVGYLQAERAAGRKLILATAAHHTIAEAVAEHLRLFDEVLASDGATNPKGSDKRDELVRRFGVRGFDYLGDSPADIPVWAASRVAHLTGTSRHVAALAEAVGAEQGRAFAAPQPELRTWLRAIRCQQWVKNSLIFVPLILAHRFQALALLRNLAAFFAFSFLASSAYIVNDLFDLGADRKHPVKCRRPFASGELSIPRGLAVALGLLAAALGLGAAIGGATLAVLAVYFAAALLYSSVLKQEPVLDVVVLASLYTLRLIVGGFAGGVHISMWLFQFSLFLFLSLALVKRYSELHRMRQDQPDGGRARGYRVADLATISQAGIGSGFLAALVLALYINSTAVQRLYAWPHALWGACPIFLYWITRIWLIAGRGEMNEDCIVFAFHDRVSYLAALGIAAVAILGALRHAG